MFVDVRKKMTEAAQQLGFRVDLLALANDCDYDPDSFAPLFKAIREEIQKYDPDTKFGEYLDGHLQRVRSEMEEFMLYRGYSAKAARIIGDAFALHDLGKILQDPEIWKLSTAKPERSEYANTERPKHTELGSDALDQIMKKINFVPTPEQEKFLDIARFMILNHHERPDGKGPRGMIGSMICPILNMAIVVDTYDGKMKTGKDHNVIIAEMKGEKHTGRLDMLAVAYYESFKLATGRFFQPDPLALGKNS